MVIKLNTKTVQGDRFSVFVPDIHTVVYTEDRRIARVEIEGGMSAGNVNWLIYAETLSGWHVDDRLEPMSVEDRETVLRRISDSLQVLDMPHRIE